MPKRMGVHAVRITMTRLTMTHPTTTSPPTSPRRARLLAALAVVALLAAACSSDGDDAIRLGADNALEVPSGDGGAVESDALGEVIDFTYEDFDGTDQSFSDLPEGPVVLNFFASWCPTCIAEMPDFETVSQNFGGEVTFLGLAMQDRVENAVALVEDTGITYEVGNDQNGGIFGIFQGLGMPTTVFLNADHTVARVHTGVLDVDSLTETINTELLS